MKARKLMLIAEFTGSSTGWAVSFLGKTVCQILFLAVHRVFASSRQLSWFDLPVVSLSSPHFLLGGQRPLCSQITLGNPGVLNMQGGLFKEKVYDFFHPEDWEWRYLMT